MATEITWWMKNLPHKLRTHSGFQNPHKRLGIGAGAMAQQLTALSVLSEDLGSIPSNHGVALNQPPITPVPRDPVFSSSLKGTRHTRGTQTYMQDKHPYTLKYKLKTKNAGCDGILGNGGLAAQTT